MFLHKDDRELFHDVIVTVSDRMGVSIDIVEKEDYEETTKKLISDDISYEESIDFYSTLMEKFFKNP